MKPLKCQMIYFFSQNFKVVQCIDLQRGQGWFIPLATVHAIVRYLNMGKGVRAIAKRFGVGASTVSRYKRQLEENNVVAERKGFAGQVLTDEMENALADFIKDMRQKGIAVSGREIRKIAFKIAHNGVQARRVNPRLIETWVRDGGRIATETWLKGFMKRRSRFLGKNPTIPPRESVATDDQGSNRQRVSGTAGQVQREQGPQNVQVEAEEMQVDEQNDFSSNNLQDIVQAHESSNSVSTDDSQIIEGTTCIR